MSERISSSELGDISAAVDRFLASPPHQACLLLVHTQILKLYAVVDHLAADLEWPLLSVGGFLAKTLITVTPGNRPRQAVRLFTEAVHDYRLGPVLCRDIDLLFEPSLHLDPLRLLLDSSHQAALIVAWPGSFDSVHLTYAVPDHAHYRTWTNPDLCNYCVISL